MASIITDKLRILNANNFISGISSDVNSYYVWVGLTTPTETVSTWNTTPPAPKDNLLEDNDYWDTMLSMSRLQSANVAQVVRRYTWTSGTVYDMYRHDYSRSNPSNVSGSTHLYEARYFVVNSDYRVYICLHNGTDPDNISGKQSLNEPTFVDLEPRAAGSDGYIWKYLFTIKPNDIIKFQTDHFTPLPVDWSTNSDVATVRDNAATSGQLKVVTITNRGVGYGTAGTYTGVPIKGDGNGAKASVTVNPDGKIQSIDVSDGGTGYTYGTVDMASAGLNGTTPAVFNVIIPPTGGHGADIYDELGANRIMVYSKLENSDTNPDFITGNVFARIGIVKDPQVYASTDKLTSSQASTLSALKLDVSSVSGVTFTANTTITQTVGVGSTAVGRVVSWDATTGVLKYWQDKRVATSATTGVDPKFGYELLEFTSSPPTGGSVTIVGGSTNLGIHTTYSGVSTVINNKTYYLGQEFTDGVSNPEVKKYSGDIIYVDNRPSITRSSSQKEEIKVILEF